MGQPGKKSNKVGAIYYKTTKTGLKMFNILLTADRVRELLETNVDAKGQLRLSGFENTYKEKDSQPDINIVESSSVDASGSASKGTVTKQPQGAVNARAKGSNFPF